MLVNMKKAVEKPRVGSRVKCDDGTWGLVKEVHHKKLIVKVQGLDEEWDPGVVVKVVN